MKSVLTFVTVKELVILVLQFCEFCCRDAAVGWHMVF
jgi:hypothetical protein